MKKILLIVILSCMCSSAIARTISLRDKTSYPLGQSALHNIVTIPAQPHQPVYSWRTHIRFDGSPGTLGHNATYIGETDANGVLTIFVPNLPFDPIYCGSFINERVAVGSLTSPKSNSLNFSIVVGPFGPFPPFSAEC